MMGVIKKIFIVSTVLLLVCFVFFGIYMIAFKKNDVQMGENKRNDLDIVDIVSEKMTNITSDSVVAATIGPDGETVRYYDGVDGRVWTMTLRGTNKEIMNSESMGVPQDVKWSPDGSAAILIYDNGEVYVYNHTTNTKNKLRDGMDDVKWSGVSGKILYKYYDETTSERSLNIADADGTNWKKIADLPYRFTDFTQIPSSILTAFWPRADKDLVSELFTVGTVNIGAPKKIFSDLRGVDYLFSPDGKKVLVSSVDENGKNLTMGIMDANGKNYNDLMIPTIVKKAVWSDDSKYVYYALPSNVPENVVWPNDYTDKGFTTQDTFFRLEISSGKKTRIIELDDIKEKIDASALFLSPAEDQLFFINRINNLLYRLSL